MKDKTKMRLRNILVILAFIMAIITLVSTLILRVKHWEYSGLWLILNNIDDTLPTLVGLIISGVLLAISNLLEK